jgi:uncharacterized protein
MKLILVLMYFLSISFVSQLKSQQLKTVPPFVLGHIDTLYSDQLKEKRVLNIYLPEGYSPDSAKTYSVIYLLDGSADEDFIHVAGLVQFCNFPWVNSLPKSIVVGIANVDRKRDFTYPTTIAQDKKDFPTTGGSEKFISFIENELQPYIQKNYKCGASKILIGQSLGGLLAVEILYKKPQLFTHYAILSPSLWWDNESLFKLKPKVLQNDFLQSTQIFIAVGKEGKQMEGDAKKLFMLFKSANKKSLKVNFKFLANKNHASIAHQAIYEAFESFSF